MKLKRLLQSACTRDGTRIGIVATYAQLFLYNGSGRSCAAGTALAAHRGRRTRCRLRAAPEPLWQGANPDVVIAVCVKHKQHSADEHCVAVQLRHGRMLSCSDACEAEVHAHDDDTHIGTVATYALS